MAKKKQSKITSNNNKHVATKERIVTMQALQEQSDSDDDDENSPLPPESEWNAEAKALKARIEEGKFDQLVRKMENKKQNKKEEEEEEEEESSIEEVDLYDENSAEESRGNEEMAEQHANELESEDQNEEDSDLEEEDVAIDNEEQEQDEEEEEEEEEHVNEGNDSGEENENEVDNNDDSEEEEASGDDKNTQQANEDNENRSKALHIVTETLVAEKSKWPWAETFDVISETPLPFGTGENDINIHDDLKRELAFYDMALEAVMTAKKKCQEANIPFTRPDDFFAEMVKTDDHMAKVKDRLIFENKKMEAVAQRKASKEQKLRAKETQAQKQADKSKKKKEHFRAVEEWAETAASNRGRRLPDKDDGAAFFQQQRTNTTKSKKRQYYDQKYGFGGKRGRFKQNDPKTLNDPSGFNRNGNFGGMGSKLTKKTGSGSNRPGKRARDASRKRSR